MTDHTQRWTLWLCDACDTAEEAQPGDACEMCGEGTVQIVGVARADLLDLERERVEKAATTINGLLDAVERLNATIDRQAAELADLRQIAALDPDVLLEAEARVREMEEALEEIKEETDGPMRAIGFVRVVNDLACKALADTRPGGAGALPDRPVTEGRPSPESVGSTEENG